MGWGSCWGEEVEKVRELSSACGKNGGGRAERGRCTRCTGCEEQEAKAQDPSHIGSKYEGWRRGISELRRSNVNLKLGLLNFISTNDGTHDVRYNKKDSTFAFTSPGSIAHCPDVSPRLRFYHSRAIPISSFWMSRDPTCLHETT